MPLQDAVPADDLEEAVPAASEVAVPAADPEEAELPQAKTYDKAKAHIDFMVDVRGDGRSLLKYDTKLHSLAAHCRHYKRYYGRQLITSHVYCMHLSECCYIVLVYWQKRLQ